ncbi:MAG: peptide chain release factor N(5)-glutamine methyltransferase [Anaerolineae bacterium]
MEDTAERASQTPLTPAGTDGSVHASSALEWGAARLRAVTERPYAEAERLLAAILQVTRTMLLAHPEIGVRQAQARVYADAVRRRAAGVPLPYILGQASFFGLDFVVTPDVLIPRPETEHLVEQALAWIADRPVEGITVVDVGTGSGCIAIALTATMPNLRVTATDLSAPALAVARINGLRHRVDQQIAWVQADLLTPIVGPCDLIVSNPPYVAEPEWPDLPLSVRREPHTALLAGPEGLDVLRRLLSQARSRMAPDSCMLIEIGAGQGNAVRALAQAAFPTAAVKIRQDLAGRDRILDLRLSGPAHES